MKIDLMESLNRMYANAKRMQRSSEPDSKEWNYYRGEVKAYNKAIDLCCVAEFMPLENAYHLHSDEVVEMKESDDRTKGDTND